jgi:hypothetical protein
MLQAQARTAIADLRADIARRGYDQSEKRHLAVLFGDLKHVYSSPALYRVVTDEMAATAADKLKQVSELQLKWQEDRRNAAGGADTIPQILAQLERFIPDLPAERKSNVITIPSKDEVDADRLLAVLKQRGLVVNV